MILTNIFKRDKVSTVDIRKELSSYNTYYTQKIKELASYGKLYLHINNSLIYVSNHNHTHFQSLVDRSSNGGDSDEDVTVINKSPHWHVNI